MTSILDNTKHDDRAILNNKKHKSETSLVIDYKSIDIEDVYGLYLTNKTTKNGKMKLPDIGSFVNEYPDFIALEKEKNLYKKTSKTAIAWFVDDSSFDTIDGIYNAIIYKNIPLLKYYKNRYKNVHYFIEPDYSTYGDFDHELILHNMKKGIIVYLWLTFECNAIVYPLMQYSDYESLGWCFEHILINSNIAISLKGVMKKEEDRLLFKKALVKLIDERKPKSIIVYSVANRQSTVNLLKYAYEKKIEVHIISNTLQIRNTLRARTWVGS